MIDLQEARRKNIMRLRGEDADLTEYTKESVGNDIEQCWDIISIVTRKATTEVTKSNGTKYKKQTKDLAYPNLIEIQEVGQRKTVSKTAKNDVVSRSNIATMREMYEIRNAMNRHCADDVSDSYPEYFKSVVEILDGYALQVVTDMIESDDEFLNKINNVRKGNHQTA